VLNVELEVETSAAVVTLLNRLEHRWQIYRALLSILFCNYLRKEVVICLLDRQGTTGTPHSATLSTG